MKQFWSLPQTNNKQRGCYRVTLLSTVFQMASALTRLNNTLNEDIVTLWGRRTHDVRCKTQFQVIVVGDISYKYQLKWKQKMFFLLYLSLLPRSIGFLFFTLSLNRVSLQPSKMAASFSQDSWPLVCIPAEHEPLQTVNRDIARPRDNRFNCSTRRHHRWRPLRHNYNTQHYHQGQNIIIIIAFNTTVQYIIISHGRMYILHAYGTFTMLFVYF